MTGINFIVVSELYQYGFAEAIQEVWFKENANIIGLKYLQGHHREILNALGSEETPGQRGNVVFFDSIHEPLYSEVEWLAGLLGGPVIRVVVTDLPDHMRQSSECITSTLDLREMVEERRCLPRQKGIWELTKKTRRRKFLNNQPGVLPYLIGPGIKKTFSDVQRVTKYPTQAISRLWDQDVINLISSKGVVGVALENTAHHTLVRRFWRTYGILVLEDNRDLFPLAEDAQKVDSLDLLSSKKNLLISKRTNIDLVVDLEKEQELWMEIFSDILKVLELCEVESVKMVDKKIRMIQRHPDIPRARVVQDKDNSQIATLPLYEVDPDKLPDITVCTLTRDHRLMFPFVVNSLKRQSYPLEKIEWVVLQNGDQEIDDLIPATFKRKLKRFHKEVLPSDHGLTIAQLRNRVVELANEEFVAFMDDDDLYFHTSLLARVKAMIKYQADCVGSSEIGTYDLIQDKASVASDGPHLFSEASMAFKKSFWEQRGFDDTQRAGEASGFLNGRQYRCIAIPYHFNILSMTHAGNTTGTLRMITGKEMIPLKKMLDDRELSLVDSTATYLRQRYQVVRK